MCRVWERKMSILLAIGKRLKRARVCWNYNEIWNAKSFFHSISIFTYSFLFLFYSLVLNDYISSKTIFIKSMDIFGLFQVISFQMEWLFWSDAIVAAAAEVVVVVV